MKKYDGQKINLVAVDMGYGHQRAAFPLSYMEKNKEMVLANNYKNMDEADKIVWAQSRKPYEFISRFKRIPLLGDALFWGMDQMQKIKDFYPKRNLHRQSLQLVTSMKLIKDKRWGKHLIDELNKEDVPLVTSFFIVAYMAEEFNYKNDIYLIVCDADVSRAWASPNPTNSKIKYLVPNKRVYERLQLYGVKPESIYFTGFPLPLDNLGTEKLEVLQDDLVNRLVNLDPGKKYIDKYKKTIKDHLSEVILPEKSNHPLTITFAVGGAGAQREIGGALVKSLRKRIERSEVRLVLVAGIHDDVKKYFDEQIDKNNLNESVDKNIIVLYESDRNKYFARFSEVMRKTDILWTKPSELSFYCALGLPIVITEPLGSQEVFNRKWLRNIGAGLDQEDVRYTHEWLWDWLETGWLAEAAMQGYLEAPKYGTFNIEKVVNGELEKIKETDSVLQY